MVRYNPIARLPKFLPIHLLERFTLENKINLKNKPKNVKIYPTPVIYGPFDFQYREIGKKHLKIVTKKIEKNLIEFDLIFAQFIWSSGYVGVKLKEKFKVP